MNQNKLLFAFLLLLLALQTAYAQMQLPVETGYETSSVGRIVGDSTVEMQAILMNNKLDLRHATLFADSPVNILDALEVLKKQFPDNVVSGVEYSALGVPRADSMEKEYWKWPEVNDSQQNWKKNEFFILSTTGALKNNEVMLADTSSITGSTTYYGTTHLPWSKNFREKKPLFLLDAQHGGLFIPKTTDRANSFVGEFGRNSQLISSTFQRDSRLLKSIVCASALNEIDESSIGEIFRNARNNYSIIEEFPSKPVLGSYILYGNPDVKISVPAKFSRYGLDDYCGSLARNADSEITTKTASMQTASLQSISAQQIADEPYSVEFTFDFNSYRIKSDGNFSWIELGNAELARNHAQLLLPSRMHEFDFPSGTTIVNIELTALEEQEDIALANLPMWMGENSARLCINNTLEAGIEPERVVAEDAVRITTRITPVEVVDCASGGLRLYKRIKYKIDYIPSSDVLIAAVEVPLEVLPDAIVDLNILLKSITLNAVSGTLIIIDADANSILVEQGISGNANAVSMQFTAPDSEGMHLYRVEFSQDGEVKTSKEFWLNVKGLEAELLLPESARGATKIRLLINNPFNYPIPVSIKHSLIANDEITESGDFNVIAPQGENTAEWDYSRIYKEQQYYEVRAELEYEGKTRTIAGVLVSNNAPELAPLQDVAVKEGEIVQIDVNAFDLDNDELFITISDPLGNDAYWQTDGNDAGIYTITVTASDGMLSDVQQFSITVIPVDKTPPNIGIYEPEARDYSYTHTLDVAFDAFDSQSEIAYINATLDGQEIANDTELELNEFELGRHILIAEAADTNSNATSKSIEFNVVDDIAPVSFASISGNQKEPGIYTGKVIVELTASDGKSGVDYIEYNFDGNEEAFIRYAEPIEISNEGITNIFYRAADKSNNKETVKETRKITNNANPSIEYRNPTWIAGSERIVFDSDATGNYEVYSMNLDGSELQQLTSNSYNDFEPAVNADGSKIAFTSNRTGNEDLWLMDLAYGAETQLTSNPNIDSQSSWSPDSKQIAFASSQDDKNGIWIIDTYNNTQSFLFENSDDYNIYFSDFREDFEAYSSGVWAEARTIGWASTDAYITADGIAGNSLLLGTASLAFQRPGKSVEFKIKFTDWTKLMIDTSAISMVFWAGRGNGYLSTLPRAIPPEPPIWSIGTDPRQEQIILPSYYTGTTYAVKIAIADSQAEIYIDNVLKLRTPVVGVHPYSGKPYVPEITYINFGYGSNTAIIDDILLESSLEFSDPAFSPIADEIAFSYNFYGNKDIWLTNTSGSASRQLTKSKSKDIQPSFNPLGNAIAYTSEEADNKDIWLINIDSNKPIRLTSDKSNEEMPAWNLNDNRILFVSDRDGYSNIYAMELGKPLTIRIDNTKPQTLQTTDDAPLEWANGGVVVNLNVDANNGAYTTYYRINDENIFRTGNQIVLNESGYYVIFYYSQDSVMQEELKSTPLIKIDKTMPELTINSPVADANYLYTEQLQINFNVMDGISGIETIGAMLDGSSVENLQTINLQNMIGQHTFAINATDKAGNETTKAVNFSVIADNVAPETTDNAPSGWTNADVVVTLTAADNLSGVAKTFHSINSGAFLEGNEILLAETGEYVISYYSIDNAGNVENAKQSAKVQIDRIFPTVTVSSPEDKDYSYTANFLTQYSAGDEISGIAGSSADIDGISVQNAQTIELSGYAAGKHTITANATDLAGNSASKSIEFSVIDDVAPITSDNADKEWHNSNITITLAAADEKSNVAAIHYIVNSGAEQIKECGTQTCTAEVVIDYEDNNNKIEYWAVDEYGNAEEHKIADGIKLDKAAPQSSYEYDGLWHTADFTIPLNASDLQVQGNPSGVAETYYKVYTDESPGAVKALSVDGRPLINYEDNDTWVEYWSADIAGNEEVHKFVKEIKLDKSAPQVELSIAPQEKYYTTEPLPVVYSAIDPQVQGTPSNNLTLDWKIDGIAVENPNVNPIACSHTLMLTATDLAGNSSSMSIEYEAILELVGEAQLKITPETLNVNPGTLTAHAEFPLPYSAYSITGAYADYAAMGQFAGDNMKFRRQDIENALAERGLQLDTNFEVWGEFLHNGQTCKFEGSDDISAVEPDGEGGKKR